MSSSASGTLSSTTVGETGAPVVFLHGLFGQGRNFTQIAKALVPDFRSLLVDLPNHGRSPWTDRFDYAATADLVAAHLREGFATAGPVHVVGHSMGGKVAMVLALRHPELVDRLVVADIAPATGGSLGEFAHLLDSLAAIDLTMVTRRGEADEVLAQRVDDARVRGFLLQNLRADGDGFRWQANLDLLRRELPVIGGFPDVGGAVLDRPVLWVAGDRSDYVRPEHGPAMRRLFPRTTLVTIKGAGHWVHSEQPDAFVAVLRTFLGADER
ncbi:alpha/beta fold hydrolase [Cellulomonas wangsupingiae]|uniref:Alpha/beta fold hydrolase n=1 Tax=Cellulomonas wangsupingiae TaxID=2968085 RepID=A0ABY5K2E2_9CELL|nr:alpha/beta fold hydrolase [Cellulomonas wangsupingiae]MCC2333409.1 alpha/beta fold hydrolase [Cellulomonas wangsupingiae]UUI63596.1 alpha/beta fold hydrolase [Cellulomonas wangsupingiae]